MARYSIEDYVNMIYIYGFSNGNESEAAREYALRFPNSRTPHRNTFSRVCFALGFMNYGYFMFVLTPQNVSIISLSHPILSVLSKGMRKPLEIGNLC